MIFSLHGKDGNDHCIGKNAIQVYKTLPDSNKKTERNYTKLYKHYAKQLAKEKIEEIINELISAGIEFNLRQFYEQKVYRDNIISMYRGKKKEEVIPELDIMRTTSNSLLKMMDNKNNNNSNNNNNNNNNNNDYIITVVRDDITPVVGSYLNELMNLRKKKTIKYKDDS
jgi:hypothetical protein